VLARVFGSRIFCWYILKETNTTPEKANMPLTDAKARSLKACDAQYKVSDSIQGE